VFPSNPWTLGGLLRTALRADDPVLSSSTRSSIASLYNVSRIPVPNTPSRSAAPDREERHRLTAPSPTGAGAEVAGSYQLEQRSPDWTVEVGTAARSPLTTGTPSALCRKTAACSSRNEDCLSWGYGSEIAARIAGELFTIWMRPIGRVARARHLVATIPSSNRKPCASNRSGAGSRRLLTY